jgi:RNA polymerase sigma factor (sigma-70 family)
MSAARALRAQPVGTADERDLARRLAEFFLLRLPKSVRREDIHQAALIGLWDGLRKHDGTGTAEQRKGYLITRIKGRILDELRAQDWLPRRSRLAQASPERAVTIVRFDDLGRSDEPRDWEDRLPSDGLTPEEQCVRKSELRDAVGDLAEVPLNPRHRHILRSHYWRGQKLADIARELGVSEPRVSQQHSQAIRTLRAWNSGVLPEQPAHRGVWQGTEIRREARLAIERKHRNEHDHRAVDRRTGEPAGAPARPGPHPLAVPKRWLGGAIAPAADRPVPRRAGSGELAREALPRLCLARPEAVAPGAAPEKDGGLAVTGAVALAATEPVPSVLPEEGVQLDAELLRYRDWMIGQALLRANGSRAAAARLLGLKRTTLVEILKRSEQGETLVEKLPEADRRLQALAARIPWDQVALMRAEGVPEGHIARRLAHSLDAHRYTVEKALRLPRPIVKCGP